MIDSITHQVQQWPGDFLDHCAIYLGLLAFQHKLELFMLLKSNCTRSTIEARDHR